MQDKFSMPQEYNISFAKRMLVDSIYKSANLEGIAVTFAQTNDILNNVNVGSLKPNEIRKVCDIVCRGRNIRDSEFLHRNAPRIMFRNANCIAIMRRTL